MNWFWLNVPLMAAFFGAWVGIPLWLVFKHPDRGPVAQDATQAGQTVSASGPALTEADLGLVSDRGEQLLGVG